MKRFLLGAEREGAFNIPFKVERGGAPSPLPTGFTRLEYVRNTEEHVAWESMPIVRSADANRTWSTGSTTSFPTRSSAQKAE